VPPADDQPMSTERLVFSAIGLGAIWLYCLGMLAVLIFLLVHLVK
jgi:hypothetical protein